MPTRYRQNWNAALKRLLHDPLLRVIGPTPAPADLHHVQATYARKHIATYLIHAREMGRLHQADNAVGTGGVPIISKCSWLPTANVQSWGFRYHAIVSRNRWR